MVGFEFFMDFFVPTMFPVCSCKVPNDTTIYPMSFAQKIYPCKL
jgi:hypothetical protein